MSDESATKPDADAVRLSDGTVIETAPRPGIENSQAPVDIARPRASWPVLVLATIAVLAVLYVARDVVVPVVFALMLALLFRPVLRWMKHWRIPNAVSALLIVGGVVLLFLLAIWGLADNAQRWLAGAPEAVRRVAKMLPKNVGPVQDFKDTTEAVNEIAAPESADTQPVEEASEPNLEPQTNSQDWLLAVLGVSSHFVGASVIVFVLGYFLLALSDRLLTQAVEVMPSFLEKRNVVQLVHNVEQGVSRYLATITVINIGLGIVTALAMWLMKVPNPVLWGVMVAALNYVPHVGAFICLVVLFFVGTITHESLGYGLAVAGVFVLLTSAESYFITPLVLSKSLQLSPLAVILSILFLGWLWGVGGGLLAAPMLTVVKIVCDQFDATKPLAMLLSGESQSQSQDAAKSSKQQTGKQAA